MKKEHLRLRWVLWALASVFYLYEFFLRVSPSVMIPELMSTFNVNAAAVGNLSAFYFYIYAPMQLVVGVLVDKYGASKLLTFSSLIAGLGTIIFSLAASYWVVCFGRILMGAGSAFGFVGMIYVCSHWFPVKQRGVLIGLANAFGMLGAVAGQGPLRLTINTFGWRPTMLILGLIGLFLALLIFVLVGREAPTYKGKRVVEEHFLSKLQTISTCGYSWINAISSSFGYVIAPAFAGLWAIPFLHSAYGFPVSSAAFIVSMFFIGFGVGGPLIGRFADVTRNKKPILIVNWFAAATMLFFIVFVPSIPIPILYTLLFLLGFFSSVQLLNYQYAIDLHPSNIKGTAAAFTNFIIFVVSAISQPLLGWILDNYWQGMIENGVRLYPVPAYKAALATLVASLLVAGLMSLFLKKVKIRRPPS